MKLTIAEARQELSLSETYTLEEAKISYKKLAMEHHPDRGGSTEVFQRVGAAYAKAQDHLTNPTPRGFLAGRGGGHQHYYESDDEDDEGYSDYDDDEDDDGEDPGDFFQFLFENLFRGGNGSRNEYASYRHARPPPPPRETEAERKTRQAAERITKAKAEQKLKDQEKREKAERERSKEKEMMEGAARRENKKQTKAQKLALERAQAEQRAANRIKIAQETRSAVFAAARAGDSKAVKKGVWEQNVGAGDVERLPDWTGPIRDGKEEESEYEDVEVELEVEVEVEQVGVKANGKDAENSGGNVNGGAGGKKKGKGRDRKRGGVGAAKNGGASPSALGEDEKENVAEFTTRQQPEDDVAGVKSEAATVGNDGNGKKRRNRNKKNGPVGGPDGEVGQKSSHGGTVPPTQQSNAKPTPPPPPPAPARKTIIKTVRRKKKKPVIDDTETLLHIAAKLGDTELCTWLINHGATPEDRDRAQYTAFHYSLLHGHSDLVAYFISAQSIPKIPPRYSRTAIPDPAYPCPPGESLLSLSVISASAKTVELVTPFATVEDAWNQFCWIEEVLIGGGRGAGEKEVWDHVKCALCEMTDFPYAAVGYDRRRKAFV